MRPKGVITVIIYSTRDMGAMHADDWASKSGYPIRHEPKREEVSQPWKFHPPVLVRCQQRWAQRMRSLLLVRT